MNIKKVFYRLNTVLAFSWAWLIMLVGARRRGKTYSVKKWLLNGYIYKGLQFVIFRDTQAECDILCDNNGNEFWGDVLNEPKFANISLEITNRTIYINKQIAGYVMPISAFRKLKGSQYEKVKRGLYDEFIREKGSRYNGNRTIQFLNSLMTVFSLKKDFKLIMTANALDKGDPFIHELGEFDIKDFGIYKNRQRGIILDYIPNSDDFTRYQQDSNIYKLVHGTRFENNLINNKFVDDEFDSMFYDTRKPCDLYGIYYDRDGNAVRIWERKDGDGFYCGKDTNPNSANYMRFTFDVENASNRIGLAPTKEKKFLQELFANNLILFENKYILNIFKEIIKGGKK